MRAWLICGLLLAGTSATATATSRQLPMADFVQDVWDAGENGPPHPGVTAIRQTRDGYLWLTTFAGVARFDGLVFTRPEPRHLGPRAPLGDHVRTLLETSDGAIWLATRREGLLRIQGGVAESFSRKDGLPSDEMRALAETADHTLWIASGAGLVARDPAGRFRTITTADGLPVNDVVTLYVDTDGTLWAGTRDFGVARFDGARFQVVPLRIPRDAPVADQAFGVPPRSVGAFARDRGGVLWAGTGAGVAQVPEHGESTSTFWPGAVSALAPARDGGLWVATGEGLGRLANGSYRKYTTRDGLLSDVVMSVYEDDERSVWLGTAVGLARLRPRMLHTYTRRDGLGHDSIHCVLETRDGAVWVGHRNGLSHLNKDRWTTLAVADGLPNASVRALVEGPDGALWIGTLDGLARYKDRRFTTYRPKPTPADPPIRPFYAVRALAFDAGGRLWISSGSLDRLDGDAITRVLLRDELCERGIHNTLHVDADGALWLGTQSALIRVRDGRSECSRDTDVLSRNDIRTMARDADGQTWIGSAGGLARLENGTVRPVTGHSGPFDAGVFGLLDDTRGGLWCSTPRGLFRIDKATLAGHADGGRAVYRAFGTADGMDSPVGTGAGQPTAWRSRDGRLWFATATGVAVVDPARVETPTSKTPIYIERLAADRHVVDLGGARRLPAGTREVELHFALLSFISPEQTRYEYRLDGYDAEWVPSGSRRVAYYTNLAPGSYRFDVRASSHSGAPRSEAAVLFSIAPLFHQTLAFKLLVLAALVAGAAALHRLRVRRIRAAFEVVLAERNRIARELHDTLDQGLAATGMQIQAAEKTVRQSPEEALDSLELAREFLKETLEEGRRSVWALRSQALEHGGLPEALGRVARELTSGTTVAARVDVVGRLPRLSVGVESHVLRIGQEAMTNAVRHGAPRTIVVTLTGDGERLRLSVRDDGVGFDAGTRAPGLGLRGMQERAHEIGGTLLIQSRAGSPGTEVSLDLAVPKR